MAFSLAFTFVWQGFRQSQYWLSNLKALHLSGPADDRFMSRGSFDFEAD
jgi:hypothetical protein